MEMKKMSFREFQSLPPEIQDARMWLKLSQAISNQSYLESQRIASVKKIHGKEWRFVLLKRYGREEVWVIFRPEDAESAKQFHSYSYFKEAFEAGETILAAFKHCAWNVLCSTDEILGEMMSTKSVCGFEIKNRSREAAKRYGV
jgi:hypothetical protein